MPTFLSYGVYISHLIQFARVSSQLADYNTPNNTLTANRLQQGYRYHKLKESFFLNFCRHHELVNKYDDGLKALLLQGLSEPNFYDDLVCNFRKIVEKPRFSDHFRKIVICYKRKGFTIGAIKQFSR